MDFHTRLAVALAFIALIFPSTFSAPTVPQSCTPVCRKSHESKLNYEEGKSYVYGFETEVVTQVVGSTDDQNRIKVKGHAVLAAQSSCDFVLTLQQVAIQSPSGQAISRIDDIEGSSVRFAYQDGVIDGLCVSEGDPTWSANVKRGIVSMLGNKAGKIVGDVETVEVDITGRCPTTYSVSGHRYTKTRDLNSCTNRDGGFSIFHGVAYNVPSKHNSASMLDSNLTCHQDLRNGVFQSVNCEEVHKLVPMASGTAGAQTIIKSTLNLLSTQDGLQGAKAISSSVPSSIYYDHSESEESQRQKSSALQAVDLLNKLCSEVSSGSVSSKVPGLFLQLKKTVSFVRKDDLKLMYDQITTDKLCKQGREKLEKLYIDSLAMAATDGTIAFVAELITSGQASEQTKALFNLYTTFAAHPGPQALVAVESLISKSDADSQYLLTASGLAHQYCKMTNAKCVSNNEYYSLVNKIAQHVRSASDKQGIDDVITALQALGNLDQLTPEAVDVISGLLNDASTSNRLKIRALDAFRRNPCQEDLKKQAQKIFGNIKQSSEVRIQAYLAISKCLQERDIGVIQTVLNKEQSNQVGSFVSSHIDNLRHSSSPGKRGLKSALKHLSIPKHFPTDGRKFSRNIELSMFSPDMNLGYAVDSNVIFSQDSYIPRTASANLTIDTFGRSYNFFEFGLYLENFEHLIEEYFGPAGKARKSVTSLVSQNRKRWRSFGSGLQNRVKRDVNVDFSKHEIEAIQERVKIEDKFGDDGNADIYVRVLGTSLFVETITQSEVGKRSLSQELLRGMDKLVDGAKDHKFDLTEPILFIDDELVVPTISGLPINCEIVGTSVLSLQMQGNLDLPALFKGNMADMKAKIIPSAATLLKAKMSVGSGPIESGLQLEGKIHTASGVDVKVVREKGKFEVRMNIPQERIQIIDVRSDIYWVEQSGDHLEKKTPIKSIVPQRSVVDNECLTTFSKVLGLKVCADIKMPRQTANAPYFPLNGPSVLSVSVEKVENTMEGYYLKVEVEDEDVNNLVLDVVLDTPGSRTNRKITANSKLLNYKIGSPKFTLDLESPFKTIGVEYERSNTDALRGVNLKIVNDGEAYTGKVQLKKTDMGSAGYELEPLVQYSVPSGSEVNLIEGKITRVVGKKIQVDLRSGGPYKSAHGQITGSVEVKRGDNNNADYSANGIELVSKVFGKILLDGTVGIKKNLYDADIRAKYGEHAQHEYSLKSQLGNSADKKLLKLKSRSSRRSFLNIDVDWTYSRNEEEIVNSLKYSRGLDAATKVLLSQTSKIHFDSVKNFDIQNEFTLVNPNLNIDLYLKSDAKNGAERKADFILKAGKSVNAAVKFEAGGAELGDYSLKGTLVIPDKNFEISEVATQVAPNEKSYKSRVAVTPGFWYEADTVLYHRFERGDVKADLSTKITSDQFSDPIAFKSSVSAKKDNYEAALKLDAKGANYLDVSSVYKISKGQKPSTVHAKAFVKEYLDSKLTQSISRGESDLKFEALWIPTGRKIVATSDLKSQGDLHNLAADFKWDAERDPSQSATIRSTTTLTLSQWLIDSKNDIKIQNRESEIIVKGKIGKQILNGQHSAEIHVKSFEGNHYAAVISNTLENQPKSKSSKLQVKIEVPETQPYEFEWENRVANLDLNEAIFEFSSDVKVNYKGEKNVNLHTEINSVMPGNYRSFSGQFEADGNAISQPIALSAKTDIKRGHAEISLSGKRGSRKGDIDLKIDYDRWSPKKRLEILYKIHTPVKHVKSIEGNFKYIFLYESLENLEIGEYGGFSLNGGSPYTWTHEFSLLTSNLNYKFDVVEAGNQLINLAASGKLERTKFSGSISSVFRGQKSELNIHVGNQFPNVDLRITGTSPIDKLKNFELKIDHRSSNGGQIYETDVFGKTSDDRVKISNKLELFPQRKSIDFTVAIDDQPARQLFLSLAETEKNKWLVETKARWGDEGRHIFTKGNLAKSDENLDLELNVDSPILKADNWNVRLTKKFSNGRHSVALAVDGNNKKYAASVDYAKKEERSGTQKTYDGSVKVEAFINGEIRSNFDGNFRVEDTTMDKKRDNGEEGRQFSGFVQISGEDHPLKVSFLGKRSNIEKRLKISVCNEGDEDCKVADLQLRHHHGENGDLDYQLRAITESIYSGKKSTDGISIRTNRADNGQHFEHQAELILGKEKKDQIGYRIYRKDGKEVGIELLLPERVISLILVAEKTRNADYKADISFFVDKTKQPNRKINLGVNIIELVRSTDNAKGREAEIVFHHPDLSKDLKVKSSYVYGGEKTVLDLETVLDVFEVNKEITVVTKVLKEAVADGKIYRTEVSVKSEGQHINIGAKGEIKRTTGTLSAKSRITYENRAKQTKSSKIEFLCTANQANIELDGPEGRVLSITSSWENHPSGFESRYELFLPGMEDARIIQTQILAAAPPHAHVKTYTSSSQPGEFLEAWFGFKSEKHFVVGLYDQKSEGRGVLADFNVALNTSRILFIKADWDIQNIKNVLARGQKRIEKSAQKLKELISSSGKESCDEIKHLSSSLNEAAVNWNAVKQSFKKQLSDLEAELNANEDTKQIMVVADIADAIIRENSKFISDAYVTLVKVISRTVYALKSASEVIPDVWQELIERIPDSMEEFEDIFDSAVDALVEVSNAVVQSLSEVVDRFTSANPAIGEKLNWISDNIHEASETLERSIVYTLENLTKLWKVLKVATNDVLENSTVKVIMQEIIARYKTLLAEFIEDTKEHADSIRKYVLKALPGKEVQEIIELVVEYVEKKTRQETVDDAAATREIYDKLVALVKKTASEIFTVDWEHGLFIAQIPLPKSVENLTDMIKLLEFKIPSLPTIPKLKLRVPSYSYGIRESINKLRNGASLDEVVPPFDSYALLIGSQYYRTFDGKFYHFEGKCEYLLTSDFDDGNFSVVASYDNNDVSPITKSIIVRNHEDSVAIKPDSTIVVNGQPTDVTESLDVGSMTVTKTAKHIIIRGAEGFSVGCSLIEDVCAVKISGFYHGKVAGLLGTHNHEQYDDLTTPEGNIEESAEKMAATWKLDNQCTENPIPDHSHVISTSAKDKCASTFESRNSSLRPCNGVVEPSDYKSICENLSNEKGYDVQHAVCVAAAGYSKACYFSHANVETVPECRKE